MALTQAQAVALNADIEAETDPVFVAYRTAGNTGGMANWYNIPGTIDAWRNAATGTELFEAMTISKYIALVGGTRDAYNQMLNQGNLGGVDFTRQKMRNALVDVWGSADSVPVLQAMTFKALRGGEAIGGTSRTTNTVTALALSFYGQLTNDDIVQAQGT